MFGGIGWKIIAMAKKGAAAAVYGLFGWGRNSSGQIGLANTVTRSSPVQVGTDSNWNSISVSLGHTLAVKNGQLWAWGSNTSGQLGTGNLTNTSSPVQVGTDTNWSSVAAMNTSSFAIKTNGTLWSWGANTNYGFLGQGLATNITRSVPIQIGTDTNWQSVSPSPGYFVHAIKTNGTLWAWGRNNYRQLGIPAVATINSPTQTITTSDWSVASGGMDFTLAVKTGGSLWSWGRNNDGQLGLSNIANQFAAVQVGSLTNWSKVTASNGYGRPCSGSIKTDGTLWTWGNNYFYNLGLGNRTNRSSPVQVGSATDWNEIKAGQDHFVAIKATNQLWLFGNGNMGQMGTNNRNNGTTPFRLGTATDWTAVGAGRYTSGAIGGGKLWMWGDNSSGKLGINSSVASTSSPIQVGTGTDWSKIEISFGFSMALKTGGSLWAWGSNASGNFGNSSTANTSSPVQVGTATDWVQISIGQAHGAAIRTGGTLWTWGSNASGQLGLNDFTSRSSPVQVGTATDWASVSCGRNHTFAIKTNNTIWAIGGPRTYGRLATADGTLLYNSPVQVGVATDWSKVSGGQRHAAAVKTTGSLWSWGQNGLGQLGLGDNVLRSSPIQVGTGTDWSNVYSQRYTTIAKKTNNSLWGFGLTRYGQLQLFHTGSVSSPVQIGSDTNWSSVGNGRDFIIATRSTGSLWGWGHRQSGRLGTGELITFYFSPVQVTTNTNWSSLSLGSRSSHNFLLTTGNALYGIGYNGNGQLGSILDIAGANVSLVSPVQLGTTDWSIARNGATSTLARKTNGTLWAWGRNNNGQLGQGNVTDRSSPVQIGTATDWSSEIASARYSGFAIKTGGTLWAWGLNTNGRLGINSSVANTSSPIQVGTGTDWSNVSAGANHTLAVKTNGTLWAWGTNTYGQLGINNATNRSSPVQVGTDTNWSRAFCNTNTGSSGPVSFAIKTNGTLWAWGRNAGGLGVFYNQNATAGYVPVQIGTGTDWASAGTGIRSSFAIKTGGTLWAWGYNSQGVLGLGDVTTRSSPVQIGTGTDWSKVDGSRTSTFAIKTGGTLWAWGYNGVGQLGQGNTTVRSSPVQVGTGTDWSNISASGQNVGQFVLALKTGGTLWSWGGNGYGQLGLGDTTNRSSPVQVGTGTDWAFISAGGNSYNALSSFAIKTNGTLWAWGSNYAGVLGLGDTTNRSSPVQVGTDTNWSKVSNGGFTTGSTLAIKTNGTLWAWGRNNYGQLGLGDTTVRSSPVQVGTDTDWTQVVSSTFATLAVKTNGTLWSWGSNGNANSPGIFGNGYITYRSSPIQVGTDTNWAEIKGYSASHVIARKTDGTLWSWGRRGEGQGGVTLNTTNISSPVQVGSATDWALVSAGVYHLLAIKTGGSLFAWGTNNLGQLGQGFTGLTIRSPVQVGTDTNWSKCYAETTSVNQAISMAIRTTGTLWAWGGRGSQVTSTFIPVNFQRSPIQITSLTNWDTAMNNSQSSYTGFAISNP